MTRTLDQKLQQLPAGRRKAVVARAAELIEQELSLRQLRKALAKTQVDVARQLGVGQDTVSRYERRTDMLLSTLQAYVEAMGGQMTIIAEFPDRPPVRIASLSELDGES